MADPLFYPSRAELLKVLKLSKACPDGDVSEQVDQFILATRAEIYSCFGDTRIASVLTTPYTEAPTTPQQYERVQFADLEWTMILHKIVVYTNITTVDGARMAFSELDAAAPYLIPGVNQRHSMADRIHSDVERKREALGGCLSAEPLNTKNVRVAVTDNSANRPVRGASVFRNRRF